MARSTGLAATDGGEVGVGARLNTIHAYAGSHGRPVA